MTEGWFHTEKGVKELLGCSQIADVRYPDRENTFNWFGWKKFYKLKF